MVRRLREPVSALTHLGGAALSVVGLVLLVRLAAFRGMVSYTVGFAIFGGSLVCLYLASGLYHALRLSPRGQQIMRRIDHISIYLLIAGTYTPFCLGPLRGVWGWSLLAAIWGLAAVGIAVKLLWMSAPRWLYVTFYVAMGWLIVVAFYPLTRLTPTTAVAWLVAGGIVYTLGAVVYAAKWPQLRSPWFGFHEIWHLFVLGGSISHFVAVWYLIA